MDIDLRTDAARFGVRAVAVFVHDGYVLLHHTHGDVVWNLPGGRVRMLETATGALRREMLEEVGEEINVGSLQWTVELFHGAEGHTYHEIGLYFLAEFRNPSRYDRTREFQGMEGDTHRITYRWFPISQIDAVPNLVPAFLNRALRDLPAGLQHIVHDETGSIAP